MYRKRVKIGKKQFIFRVIMSIFHIFPIQKNKIVVSNFLGRGFGDNPKYIIEELNKNDKKYNIYWLVKDLEYEMPDYIMPIRIDSMSALYHLSTAHVWIDNCRKPIYCKKKKGQFYIQTWHGLMGFKKIEKEAVSITEEYKLASKNDSKMIDILLSGSRWCTEMLRRSFWYDGKILEIGSPRNDIFFSTDDNMKNEIKHRLNQSNDFLVLYAPTFRQYSQEKHLYFNFDLWVKEFENVTNKKCKIFLRFHPNMNHEDIEFSENVIDVSSYPDMQELLVACDALVTDYSSAAFEAALAYKPVFLLCNDYFQYIKVERSLFFDMNDLPFPFFTSEKEFINTIAMFNNKKYVESVDEFFTSVGSVECGKASAAIAEIIERL